MVRDICGNICKRDAGLGDNCSRSIGDGTAQAGLIDGLRADRWAVQQHYHRSEPSRRCEFEHPHHNLQNDHNSASVPNCFVFIAIYFV
jgi:hypothetical protein